MLVTSIFSFSKGVSPRVVKTGDCHGGKGPADPRNALYQTIHDRIIAEHHNSVGSVADLRTAGRWFDPRLGQYFFRGLMIVVATGFIPLSPLSVVSTMVMWESSQWLGRNIMRSTG